MTNFDFLLAEEKFESFADIAVAAEKILPRCFGIGDQLPEGDEFAVKWMYSVDDVLWSCPGMTSWSACNEYRRFAALWTTISGVRLDFIRRKWKLRRRIREENDHERPGPSSVWKTYFIFMDFISYCYGR